MIQVAVHIGTHKHPVADGDCKKTMKLIND
jgi:hypothetical protein